MELERNGVREKSFLGVLLFGHPYCSSINSSQFNVEHKNTCSFPCHIGNSIPTFRDMYLHVIVRKINCFLIFCIKFILYKKVQIFKKKSYKNLFFILLLYYALTEKPHGNALSKKEKLRYFSNYKFLLIKQLSISPHSTKLMILLLLIILLQYSIPFI